MSRRHRSRGVGGARAKAKEGRNPSLRRESHVMSFALHAALFFLFLEVFRSSSNFSSVRGPSPSSECPSEPGMGETAPAEREPLSSPPPFSRFLSETLFRLFDAPRLSFSLVGNPPPRVQISGRFCERREGPKPGASVHALFHLAVGEEKLGGGTNQISPCRRDTKSLVSLPR